MVRLDGRDDSEDILMAAIDAQIEGLRESIWKARTEGIVVGIIIGIFATLVFNAIVYSPLITGPSGSLG